MEHCPFSWYYSPHFPAIDKEKKEKKRKEKGGKSTQVTNEREKNKRENSKDHTETNFRDMVHIGMPLYKYV